MSATTSGQQSGRSAGQEQALSLVQRAEVGPRLAHAPGSGSRTPGAGLAGPQARARTPAAGLVDPTGADHEQLQQDEDGRRDEAEPQLPGLLHQLLAQQHLKDELEA